MAHLDQLEAKIELKSPAEMFYKLLKSENHHIPTASSDKVQSIEVHEGDWETAGSVKVWNYNIDGKAEIFKERIEVDEANKTVTLLAIEGHILDLYKSWKTIIKVESGLAKITLEYEKLNEEVPAPNNYLQFVINVLKDIDAHVIKG